VATPPSGQNVIPWYCCATHVIYTVSGFPYVFQHFEAQIDEETKVTITKDGEGTTIVSFSKWVYDYFLGWTWEVDEIFTICDSDDCDVGWFIDAEVLSVWLVYDELSDITRVVLKIQQPDGDISIVNFCRLSGQDDWHDC